MDERGGVCIERTIGSVVQRTRRENAASKRRRKSYRFNGENEGRKANQVIRLQVCMRSSPSQKRRSPLRLNVSGRERQRRVVPGIQEHENRVQLSPGKGISLEMSQNNKYFLKLNTEKGKGKSTTASLRSGYYFLTESCPWESDQAKIDCRGVAQIEFAPNENLRLSATSWHRRNSLANSFGRTWRVVRC